MKDKPKILRDEEKKIKFCVYCGDDLIELNAAALRNKCRIVMNFCCETCGDCFDVFSKKVFMKDKK